MFVILFVLFSCTSQTMQIPAGIMPYTYYKNEGYVLFVQESTAVKGRQLLWNSCGGKAEGDETPMQTACRECSEETKYLWGNILDKYRSLTISPTLLTTVLTQRQKENILALELPSQTHANLQKVITAASQESYNYFFNRINECISLQCLESNYKLYFAQVDYIEASQLRNAPITPDCYKENYAWVSVKELCSAIKRAERKKTILSNLPPSSVEATCEHTKVYRGTAQLLMSTKGKKILNHIANKAKKQ